MMKDDEKVYTSCLILILTLFALPFMAALNGLAISYMWSWFFMEKFGLPPLGIAEAVLLSILLSFLTIDHPPRSTKDTRDSGEVLVDALASFAARPLRPLLALGMFYIVMLFL